MYTCIVNKSSTQSIEITKIH